MAPTTSKALPNVQDFQQSLKLIENKFFSIILFLRIKRQVSLKQSLCFSFGYRVGRAASAIMTAISLPDRIAVPAKKLLAWPNVVCKKPPCWYCCPAHPTSDTDKFIKHSCMQRWWPARDCPSVQRRERENSGQKDIKKWYGDGRSTLKWINRKEQGVGAGTAVKQSSLVRSLSMTKPVNHLFSQRPKEEIDQERAKF